jgi:GNAT superfamily N-acetyltransferase
MGAPAPTFPSPRRLTLEDLPACSRLGQSRGWAAESVKWELLLKLGECWGMSDPAGGLAAAVTLMRFEPHIAVIGMMIVREDRGRSGLGRALMEHVLESARPATVFLYASAMGRPLYERLGFAAGAALTRHFGCWASAESGHLPGIGPALTERVVAADREAFGADRSAWITALIGLADRTAVLEREGRILGFGIAWRNVDRVQIGPVIASDEDGARELILTLAHGHDLPLRLDLAGSWSGLSQWLQEHGLEAFPHDPQMVLGGKVLPGARSRIVTLACGATG